MRDAGLRRWAWLLQHRYRVLRTLHKCIRCRDELLIGERAQYLVWVLKEGREFGYGYQCWDCEDRPRRKG